LNADGRSGLRSEEAGEEATRWRFALAREFEDEDDDDDEDD
jgi:hypothetical protein